MKPTYFATSAAFRRWLKRHYGSTQELLVGFYTKASGKPSITWPEAVDQLLCFGWIDGVRKSINTDSYNIRVTPRRPGSTWSAVNINRAGKLRKLGLMHPAGLKAYTNRDERRAKRYSFERARVQLDPELERKFRQNRRGWKFFQAQPPWYRKTSLWWVVSAKQGTTRQRRLSILIGDSARSRRIALLRRYAGRSQR